LVPNLPIRDAVAILRQFSKGAYSPDPNDSNYSNHHNMVPAAPSESLTPYVGVHRPDTRFGLYAQPVNVRVSAQNLYVDTMNTEAVSSVGRLARRRLQQNGVQAGVVPLSEVTVHHQGSAMSFELPATVGGGTISVIPHADLRRPNDMSAAGQLKNAWRLSRGR
jgi:hypothetical protein